MVPLANLPLAVLLLAPSAAAPRPSVLLVTLDTVRADRMGFLGSTRGLTPNLDRLAARAAVFERAYSQAPMTMVSHATLLSGTFPQYHGVNDFGKPLPASVPYLPAVLSKAGYRTGAFVGSLILEPQVGMAAGFDRGFSTYDAGYHTRRGGEDRYQSLERRADEVVSRALRWLAGADPSPFFLWVHLFDAHAPYEPPAPFSKRHAQPYDGEVAYVDRAVGRLLEAVEKRPGAKDTIVVVASDHGEGLGDHGEDTHGVFLYDATLHVPLLLALPRGRSAPTRVKARVSLVDVAPTVLQAVGLPVAPGMQGESLLPLLGAAGRDRASYAETSYPLRAFGWSPLASWRADRFLFVDAPRRELYDVGSDPAAARNLAGQRASVADRMAAEMAGFVGRTRAGGSTASGPAIDPATRERLAALGYVAGGAPTAAAAGGDPKDKVALANAVHAAMEAVENGRPAKAVALLEGVVAKEPRMQLAQMQLGTALARQGRYPEAIPFLRKAIELDPDAVMSHYELGLALLQTGRLEEASKEFEFAVAAIPDLLEARFALGSAQVRLHRLAPAAESLRAVLARDPRHFRSHLLLGRVLTVQGLFQEALPHLQRAAEIEPESSEARNFLADDYEQLGRGSDAQRERIRAQELEGARQGKRKAP